MKYKVILYSFIVLILVFNLIMPSYSQAASNNKKRILVVYDGLADQTTRANNVENVVRQLISMGKQVTLNNLSHYRSGTINKFNYVIYIVNRQNDNIIKSTFEKELMHYKGHFFQIGGKLLPHYADVLSLHMQTMKGMSRTVLHRGESQKIMSTLNIRFIHDGNGTYFGKMSINGEETGEMGILSDNHYIGYMVDLNNTTFIQLVAADMLKKWLDFQIEGSAYLTLTDVTPFSNYKVLTYVANELYNRGIPFIVVAQPVLSNLKSDPMKRYINLLDDLQDRNGSIFIGAPIVYKVDYNDNQLLKRQMNAFINILADHQIAPLGILSQNYWLFDRQYQKQGLGFFSAVINTRNISPLYWRDKASTSLNKETQLFSIPLREMETFESKKSSQSELPLSVALTYNVNDFKNKDTIKKFLNEIQNNPISINDFSDNSVETNSNHHIIKQKDGEIYIDQVQVYRDITKRSIEIKQHEQPKPKQSRIIFAEQNRFLILFFTFILILFIVFLIISWRYYKRKYLKD